MKKYIFITIIGLALCVGQLQAQQIFKGKITYKTTFSGDEKLIEQAKLFLGTTTEVVSDGKKFRYYIDGGMRNSEFVFEAGKNVFYSIDTKKETITKNNLKAKSTRDRKVTAKKTGKVKIIAGIKTHHVELYNGDKKQVEVWLSDEYYWNLKDHPYKVKGMLLEGSFKDLKNQVILALTLPHPSGKAAIEMTAQEVDTNVPKGAFKLPKGFKMVDETKPQKTEKKDEKKETVKGGE
ncbi:hypothetical protein [uncultured Microscilla sp.]|uniref:hypothetical protein n=1 Tax=uncultured Microscilla sp. TaxID=432653 RepID=UPI00261C358C|nr:hypothetical protein [uncultured Microscilla sp.]